MAADNESTSRAVSTTAATQWPSPDTVRAIGEQAQRLSTFVRDTLPTTAARRPFGAFYPPGPVLPELDRLTYLFYGRTLQDFEDDRIEWARLGWWASQAGWIVATPGPHDFPGLAQQLARPERVIAHFHADYLGWRAPVPSHVGALFNATVTLRVYFGQIVFARGHWIQAGDWLRDEIQSRIVGLTCHPQSQLGPWFEGEFCRMPSYLLRPPDRFAVPSQLKGPLPVPDEIRRCGTFDNPKTDGIPVEWLDAIDHHAAKLLAALSGSLPWQSVACQEELDVKSRFEKSRPQWDAATEARNKWLYEEACKGTPYKVIVTKLAKKPKSWERIESISGIKRASRAYAERHGLFLPPARQSGRPTGPTPGRNVSDK